MKIVYRGGHNKKDPKSIANSMFYEYRDIVNVQIKRSKKVVSINFAKPDGYYDERIDEVFEGRVEKIDESNTNEINWESYNIIFLPGGRNKELLGMLQKTNFDTKVLKKNVVIVGDSAGAFAMSSLLPLIEISNLPRKMDDIKELFVPGYFPEAKIMVVCHMNNPHYVSEHGIEMAKTIATAHGYELILLEENQSALYDGVEIRNRFNLKELFNET